jgi:hypothetical protein
MPIAGKGMLITAMDVDPAEEADFNLWYDREHLAERVAIDGFNEARRWVAESASPKYFCTYSTASFEVLSSPAYARALASQTDWSRHHIAKFRNMQRAIGRISVSRGQGRGAALAVVRLRPQADQRDQAREQLRGLMDPGSLAGIISTHLVESDPALSRSLTDPDAPNPGASDWFLLLEGTVPQAVAKLADSRFRETMCQVISTGTYRLMWELYRADL